MLQIIAAATLQVRLNYLWRHHFICASVELYLRAFQLRNTIQPIRSRRQDFQRWGVLEGVIADTREKLQVICIVCYLENEVKGSGVRG